jgi:hypothetical protein
MAMSEAISATTSPRVAPPRVTCGPWAATCAADSAGRCTTALGGPSPSSLPTTTWIWSRSARATAYPDEEEAALAEVERLDAVVEGPSAALASSFEVEILPPVSSSEAGPDSAEGGNDAEGAAPPPVDT